MRNVNVCNGLRISTVDNFQGEENDIILLSLVRCNKNGIVGFLKVDNRICVALSRAKQGLYIVGNLDQLCASTPLWQTIRDSLQETGSVGESLTLVCQNHPYERREVKTGEEIAHESPEGGCRNHCGMTIPRCGHICPRICHNDNFDHTQTECRMFCKLTCENSHPCPKECNEKCPPCSIVMDKVLLCGHKHKVECGNKKFPCPTKVDKIIPACEHSIKLQCHEDPEKAMCTRICDQLLQCGHNCCRRCHVNKDNDHKTLDCSFPCTKECENKHPCTATCSEKCPPCLVKMQKTLPCGHKHEVACSVDNFPCPTKVHKVIPSCGHKQPMLCKDDPAIKQCKAWCDTKLDCGHQCQNSCHVFEDPHHFDYDCTAPCGRYNKNCKGNHPCKRRCGEDCLDCKVKVNKVIAVCGHTAKVLVTLWHDDSEVAEFKYIDICDIFIDIFLLIIILSWMI